MSQEAKTMLEQFVAGELNAKEFETNWSSTFGDLDAAFAECLGETNPYALMALTKEELLKEKAIKMLEYLTAPKCCCHQNPCTRTNDDAN